MSLFHTWQNSKLGSSKTASTKRSSTKVLNQPDPAPATGAAPQRPITNSGWSFLLVSRDMASVLFSWSKTRCHLSEYRLVCYSLKQNNVATVLSPAGGAGADVISREAEGTEPAVEKFNSVRPNSLDIFSPARDGQIMASLPSCVFNKWNTFSLFFVSKW